MEEWTARDAHVSAARRDEWLGRLVEEHGEAAYRTAYRLLRDRHEAHDAVQDALAIVFRRWEQLRSPDAARAWFFRILVNRCISRQRRRAVRERALALLGRMPEPRSVDPSVAMDVSERVLPHLARLPIKQRTALVLRFAEEHSVQEIADAMNIGTESVKTHLKRGLAELRKLVHASKETAT